VNLICAATFIAAVGDPRRFLSSRKLVAYLGLDPKVRQSGDAPARSGRISKRGSAAARWALVEAASSAVLQPGPLHAFYDRTRARRGHGKAIVATARKLAILFWCMLTRGEDYAHQQPSLTKKKLRRLQITAGAPKYANTARGIWSTNLAIRQAERELAEQAEASYKQMIKDQQAGAPARKVGASATPQQTTLREIEQTNRPLCQAYLLKEHLRQIYRLPVDHALNLLTAWLEWARDSKLAPFQRLADTITEQRAGIEAAIRHRLSNARVEAINTQIRLITRRAFGFHGADALIALTMLSLAGLCPPLPH
jgi:Transposase/Transposase IS116/IS110/IS902 family